MKLKELLELVLKVQPKQENLENTVLKGDTLRGMYKELMKTNTFANTNLQIIDDPNTRMRIYGELMNQSCITTKLSEDEEFKGDFYLYSISITPRTYTTNIFGQFDDNLAMVTPNIYDPETFAPYKFMTFKWSPELAQDVSNAAISDAKGDIRETFHNLLDDVLDSLENNDTKYLQKGIHGVLITGIWDKRHGNNKPMGLILR